MNNDISEYIEKELFEMGRLDELVERLSNDWNLDNGPIIRYVVERSTKDQIGELII